jgi:hypothetical protein
MCITVCITMSITMCPHVYQHVYHEVYHRVYHHVYHDNRCKKSLGYYVYHAPASCVLGKLSKRGEIDQKARSKL